LLGYENSGVTSYPGKRGGGLTTNLISGRKESDFCTREFTAYRWITPVQGKRGKTKEKGSTTPSGGKGL